VGTVSFCACKVRFEANNIQAVQLQIIKSHLPNQNSMKISMIKNQKQYEDKHDQKPKTV